MIRKIMFVAFVALAACSPPAPESIVGTWHIEDVDGGGVIDGSRLEIVFGDDGRVSGHAGCNRFNGTYTRNGDAIDIGPLASTRRACLAEALNRQETRVLESLEAVTTLVLESDGALVLTGASPARLLLRRADDAPAGDPAAAASRDGRLERSAPQLAGRAGECLTRFPG